MSWKPAEETAFQEANKKEWRSRALRQVQGIIDEGLVDEEEVVVRDTLCNLMHWCDEHGIYFEQEMDVARMNFDAELAGTL